MSAQTCQCPKHRAQRLTNDQALRMFAGTLAVAMIHAVKAEEAERKADDIYNGRTKLRLGTLWES